MCLVAFHRSLFWSGSPLHDGRELGVPAVAAQAHGLTDAQRQGEVRGQVRGVELRRCAALHREAPAQRWRYRKWETLLAGGDE